jgi:site-specific DNA-methyltransferase (adenine-specific)
MRKLPADLIDLTVTSPPYDGLRTFSGNVLPPDKFKEVADELLRIIRPGGVVVWLVQEQIKDGAQTGTSSEQRLYFRDIGFRLWERLVMARFGLRVPAGRRYGMPLEEAFVLSKGEPTTVRLWRDRRNKNSGTSRTARRRSPDGELEARVERWRIPEYGRRLNIWRYAAGPHTAKEAWVRKEHPALMPEKMAEDLILSYSRPDDLVFDPFCGLATTCKMALLNHRRYLGMEIDDGFHRSAVRRMREAHLLYEARLNGLDSETLGPP